MKALPLRTAATFELLDAIIPHIPNNYSRVVQWARSELVAAVYPHREQDTSSSLYSLAPSYEESAYLEQHASALISEIKSTEAKLAGSRKLGLVEELREAMDACEARMEGYRLRVQTVEVESERERKAWMEKEAMLVAQIDGLSNR